MIKIGDFSKLGQVSVRMLRHYDELGLLRPIHVDGDSGYRYYAMAQLPRLNRILALKDLGFSLEQIARLLDSDLSAAQIEGMLLLKRAEIEREVRDEQARLARIEQRLRYIQQEGAMPPYEVVLKAVAELRIASVREIIPTVNDLVPLYTRLYAYLEQYGIGWSLPNLIIWHDSQHRERGIDTETAAPIEIELPGSEQVQVRQLPTRLMATVVHHGGYDTIGQAYVAIGLWIEQNHYSIVGPNRQVHLHYATEADPSTDVTELQFPVEQS